MKTEHAGYAVVGESLAGISAALALAESRDRVVLLDFGRDTDTIVDLPRVKMTSLGPAMSGVMFDEAMRALLKREGVERQTTCRVTSVHFDSAAIGECTDRRWSCKGIGFAPNGSEPGLGIEGSSELHGFGVSYSASADAPFYVSRRVAVYGDAPRAVEHAWVAAQYASEVVVLLKGTVSESDEDLLNELRSSPAVTFDEKVLLQSLLVGDDGMLRGIDIEALTGGRTIDVSALFVAQHLSPVLSVLKGEKE